jgi:hypothetical protein
LELFFFPKFSEPAGLGPPIGGTQAGLAALLIPTIMPAVAS